MATKKTKTIKGGFLKGPIRGLSAEELMLKDKGIKSISVVREPVEKESDAIIALKQELEELKKKNNERDDKLKMLYEVADKGRVHNYESQKTEKKPFKVKLSVFGGGIIVGWRTVKDELVKHPTTGLTVGENQEYEVQILDHEGKSKFAKLASYPAFSNARYNQRTEGEIVSKSEGFDGEVTYDVRLDDGRIIKLNSRFVN